MSKDFRCETCRSKADRLHMRNLDGKWVCAGCIPDAEVNACPGLRERLGLQPKRTTAPRRKAA
ncbi:MAG TPA: hypothetical protein VF666_18615 [Pyrinomonadaceae bacterium]